MTGIRNRMEGAIESDRLAGARDLSSLLTQLIPITETVRILNGLFTGLSDSDVESARGAGFIFLSLCEMKGAEMATDLKGLITGLLNAAKNVKAKEVLDSCFAACRLLTTLHFTVVMAQLLDVTSPVPKEYIDVFTALVSDPQSRPIADKTLSHLCEVINETPLDKSKPTPIVMTATAILREIFKVESVRPVVATAYAMVIDTLLMRVGTATETDKAGANIEAIAAIKSFFECQEETEIISALDSNSVWKGLELKSYDDGITSLTKYFCLSRGEKKASLLSFLTKFFSQQSYVGQRIVATSMLAEFVNHAGGDNDAAFLRDVIKYLLPRVADKTEKVRKQALRGLGNLVTVWNEDTAEMATSILSSLLSASEDSDAECAAEAVASLTRIAGVVSEVTMAPMLISICFRLRPSFARKEDSVRAAAFGLFGALCRFGRGVDNDNFMEQLHTNLPIFIVHSNDEDIATRTACFNAFKQLAPLCDPSMVKVVEDSNVDSPVAYDEFVGRVAPLLTNLYSDRLRGYVESTVVYFTSRWTLLRGNAALLAALLLANSTESVRKTITLSALVAAMIKLLEEPNPQVRIKATKALAYLWAC